MKYLQVILIFIEIILQCLYMYFGIFNREIMVSEGDYFKSYHKGLLITYRLLFEEGQF